MPNWCSNIVYVKGTGEAKEKIEEIFSKEEPFAEIKPEPNYDEVAVPWGLAKVLSAKRNEVELEEPEPGRKNAWRDWRIANWGTKWEPSDLGIDLDDEGNLTLVFDTAWTPPAKLLEELSKVEGVEEVISHFYEPGADFIGIEFYEDGAAVEGIAPDLDEFMELLAEAKKRDKVLLEDQWVLDLASMFFHEDELDSL